MTKILVSSGYGAGWSTWASDKRKEIAEYQPIIDFIEAGGDPGALYAEQNELIHPLIAQMKAELGLGYFYAGGADGLEVEEVEGPYFISEYDGWESVVTAEDFW